jgi:hypothetical protein
MPDPLARSRRYRERAAECRKLASLTGDENVRAEYTLLATHYEELADVELKQAGDKSPD